MKIYAACVVVGGTLLVPAWSAPSQAACLKYVPDRLEVELRLPLEPALARHPQDLLGHDATLQPLINLLRLLGADLEPSVPETFARQLHLLRYYTIRFPAHTQKTPQRLLDISRQLRLLAPNFILRAAPVPSASPPIDLYVGNESRSIVTDDLPCGTQWYLAATGVPAAWSCGATGDGVVVADIDWGFMTDHVELSGALDASHTYNACNGTSVLSVGNKTFHGTAVAGLIAARQNDKGMQGIAYKSTIWPFQASCPTPEHSACDADWDKGNPWASAVATAAAHCDGCKRVILLEVQTCCDGNYEASIAVQGSIKAAVANHVVVVIAAGNGAKDAALDDAGSRIPETGAIVVGATSYGQTNPQDPLSNYGERVLVSAPGSTSQDLTITTPGFAAECATGDASLGAYTMEFGGTSGAAAKVAGVIALMLQKKPDLTPEQVKEHLKSTGGTVAIKDSTKPAGVFLNAAGAVAAVDSNHCGPP